MNGLTFGETASAVVSGVVAAAVVIALVLAVLRRLGVDLRAIADEPTETLPAPPLPPPTYHRVSLPELVARANAIHGQPCAGGYPIPDLPVIPGREEP